MAKWNDLRFSNSSTICWITDVRFDRDRNAAHGAEQVSHGEENHDFLLKTMLHDLKPDRIIFRTGNPSCWCAGRHKLCSFEVRQRLQMLSNRLFLKSTYLILHINIIKWYLKHSSPEFPTDRQWENLRQRYYFFDEFWIVIKILQCLALTGYCFNGLDERLSEVLSFKHYLTGLLCFEKGHEIIKLWFFCFYATKV